ncbi:hypothetical protein M0R19_06155 [Candidatus Pacearchaeota archaeon]|nr:hypothetical protein [Candidatus Pacearchaeota archaeon]
MKKVDVKNFKEAMEEQQDFCETIFKKIKNEDYNLLTNNEVKEEIKRYATNIIEEAVEVLDLIGYKLHEPEKEIDFDHLREECVDVLKFLLNIINLCCKDEEEFWKEFSLKSSVVRDRLESENRQGFK